MPKPIVKHKSKPIVKHKSKPIVKHKPKPIVKPKSKPIVKHKPKPIVKPKSVARKNRIGGGVLPQLKNINVSELAIVCHCSIVKYPELKHPQLYYIQDGIIGEKIDDNTKYIDPQCKTNDDEWGEIDDDSLMYIWGIYCPIYTSYFDPKNIKLILNNSLKKLKYNGMVLFPAFEELNYEYFKNNPINGFTFSKLKIGELSFIIDKKIPSHTEYYIFTKFDPREPKPKTVATKTATKPKAKTVAMKTVTKPKKVAMKSKPKK